MTEEGEKILISNPSEVKMRKALTDIIVKSKMTVEELRRIIGVSKEDFAESLATLGISMNEPDYVLKQEELELLAFEYDHIIVKKEINPKDCPLRPPIITIMGHVDHGKTTLLDCMRNSNIVEGEYGRITQKIGAFMVKTTDGNSITFIDTPGHEAFTNMRKRGALVTDIVILVVSAIDGCQPQTFEAIQHAKNAGVPIIVAINKIDRGTNPEEVEDELYDYGLHLEPKDGNVPVIHISAKYKKNIDLLEELILFEAELMDLRADKNCLAEGVILETKRSSENESKACTVIVQKGTLKVGDHIVSGTHYGRIKQMRDDRGNILTEAPPSAAVEVIGLKDFPDNGEMLVVVSDGEKAKQIALRRQQRKERDQKKNIQEPIITGQKIKFSNWKERRMFHSGSKTFIKEKMKSIEDALIEKIEALQEKERKFDMDFSKEIEKLEGELQAHYTYVKEMVEERNDDDVLKIIVKAQDNGTLETLIDQIEKIALKHNGEVDILDSSVGNITEADIQTAKNFDGLIMGMDIACPPELAKFALSEKVEVKTYKVIYDVLDELKVIFQRGGLSKPSLVVQGMASIKQIFEVKAAKGTKDSKRVAGVNVINGQLTKKYKYRIMRSGKMIKDSLDLSSLKHHKDEVNELKKGKDGGLSFFGFDDILEGDVLEAYELVKVTVA